MNKGRVSGTVKWFNVTKGYGFIAPDDGGKDLFVHFKDVDGDGFRFLGIGDEVTMVKEDGKKGLRAVQVVVVRRGKPSD
ncbi:MAG: cold shock domain-containing protein [Patescibacteria group bacterium]|nr:cold shock domain-containing protein [Patescibacteria group bacterium]